MSGIHEIRSRGRFPNGLEVCVRVTAGGMNEVEKFIFCE